MTPRDDTQQTIDRVAKALREHHMKGRITLQWEKTSNSAKKKWRVAAQIAVEAARVQ